jgi:hypothetical protein
MRHCINTAQHYEDRKTYLVAYSETLYDLEQGLSKTCPVMCVVQLRKAEQRRFELPLAAFVLYPRPSHSEVSIGVGCLPHVTSKAYQALYGLALRKSEMLEAKDSRR